MSNNMQPARITCWHEDCAFFMKNGSCSHSGPHILLKAPVDGPGAGSLCWSWKKGDHELEQAQVNSLPRSWRDPQTGLRQCTECYTGRGSFVMTEHGFMDVVCGQCGASNEAQHDTHNQARYEWNHLERYVPMSEEQSRMQEEWKDTRRSKRDK